jgi:hypothetical protein
MRKVALITLVGAIVALFFLNWNRSRRRESTTSSRTSNSRSQQPTQRAEGATCGDPCGEERWAIKTLEDSEALKIVRSPLDVSVRWLTTQTLPSERPESIRLPIEMQTFRVRGELIGMMEEADRDFHLVIGDLDDVSITMIAEIPSTTCAGVCASRNVAAFQQARQVIVNRFGQPLRRFSPAPIQTKVVITGVAFADLVHGQIGMAHNGIELHPVLSIEYIE